MNISIFSVFNRIHLSLVHEEIRQTGINTPMKAAWVHKTFDQWEFHGPDEFYWHGRAQDAWDARVKGWTAWLRRKYDIEHCN